MSAAAELQRAVFAALRADAGLVTRLGGPRIYDRAPDKTPFPYITFGRISGFNWDTSTEQGAEHLFTLHVWSSAKGKAEAQGLVEAVRKRLHDAPLTLADYALVNLREEFCEVRFDEDLDVYLGLMRFRAVTES